MKVEIPQVRLPGSPIQTFATPSQLHHMKRLVSIKKRNSMVDLKVKVALQKNLLKLVKAKKKLLKQTKRHSGHNQNLDQKKK